MRFFGLFMFVGVSVAVGCLLDATGPSAHATTCAYVCNTHKIRVLCNLIGGAPTWPYSAAEFYIPMCNVDDPNPGIYTYTTASGQTATLNDFPQWDTSTEKSGNCTLSSNASQQRLMLVSADQACPCPCIGNAPQVLNPPTNGVPDNSVYCQSVEGLNPGTPTSGWIATAYYECVVPPPPKKHK